MLKQKRIPECILNCKNDAWYLIFEEFVSCYFHSFTFLFNLTSTETVSKMPSLEKDSDR